MAAEMKDPPRTIEEAVDHLISVLPMKDKVAITRMDEVERIELHLSMGLFVRAEFKLLSGNQALLSACHKVYRGEDFSPEKASLVILDALWKKLRKTHGLRIVE